MKDTMGELPGIDKVRERFLVMLRDRADLIASHAIAAWESETLEGVNDNLAAVQGELHQIAGTAGTLGFGDLGGQACDCEMMIIAHLKSEEADLAICPDDIVDALGLFIVSADALLAAEDQPEAVQAPAPSGVEHGLDLIGQ